MNLFRRGTRSQPPPRWVPLTHAQHQPEADLIVNMLRDSGIPAYNRRSMAFDVPDFFGFGARVVLVPADRLDEARLLLDPFEWREAEGEDEATPGAESE